MVAKQVVRYLPPSWAVGTNPGHGGYVSYLGRCCFALNSIHHRRPVFFSNRNDVLNYSI